jgi:acyl-CoA thioester hydrolase
VSVEGRSRIRVRYAETDQMGFAWHGNFLAWFEVARTDLLRDRGMSYRELEERDLRLPVIETGVRYLRPARYDDELEIHARLEEVSGARMRFAYEVSRGGSEGPLATGFTAHAAVDAHGRPRRLPPELRRVLA